MAAPKLCVVLVSWNTRDLLIDALRSVERQALPDPLEVVVVDNASTDGSADAVATAFPRVRVTRNEVNLGFAAANNQAIRVAQSEYVLLLNPDTVIEHDGLLADWMAFMDGHPDAGASGCRLVHRDGRPQVGDAGFRPSLRTLLNHALFLSRLGPRTFPGLFLARRPAEPLRVDWVCGAALLVRRSVLENVGLLDETFFMYAEDVEWCCRMRDRGYAVYHLPQLRIVHLQGASTTLADGPISVRWLDSLRRLYAAYNPRQPALLYTLISGAGFLLRASAYTALAVLRQDLALMQRGRQSLAYFRHTLAQSSAADPSA